MPAPYPGLAHGVANALRNPYAQVSQFHTPYSSHYTNALLRSTPEGYSISSTYDPWPHGPRGQGSLSRTPSSLVSSRPPRQGDGSWYQPGNSRCTYPQCKFTGAAKSVEIHMMDRHLLYPPGWDKKKRMEWDADPSLKGKTIPIQGTSIVLNSPEALDAWIAERKKRWPTAQRAEEKKINLEEAIARGQLPLVGTKFRGTKRQREQERERRPCGKQQFQRDNILWAKRHQGREPNQRADGTKALLPSSSEIQNSVGFQPVQQHPQGTTDEEDSDEAPEMISSKAPLGAEETQPRASALDSTRAFDPSFSQPKKKKPKLPPRNPFASRPTLLRNLILPEVRMTVSNLSQAIRFLANNDFLRGVELKPGQASQNIIEVIGSSDQSSTS